MHPQINNHPKRQPRIQPRRTPLIPQRKKRIRHNKQRLNCRNITPIQRAPKQLPYPLPEPPPRGPHVVRVLPDVVPRAEFCGTEEDCVEEEFGEVGAGAGHVAHEGGAVGDVEGVVLAVPVEGEEVHAEVWVYAVEVESSGAEVVLF